MGSRMRINRSQTGKRRSHHGVTGPRLSKCECGAFYARHHVCSVCGKYRGRLVVDVTSHLEKKAAKQKAKAARLGAEETRARGEDEKEKAERPLTASGLSQK